MRKFGLSLFVALLAIASVRCPTAQAQTWHGYSFTVNRPFRDCNLQRMSSDDYITFGAHQVHTKRMDLEAISIGGTAAVAWLLHHTVLHHASSKVSAAVAGVGLGIGPHIYSQAIARKYPIDVTHDAAEVAQRMAPYALTFADDGSFAHRASALLWSAALVTVGSCDAQY